MRATITHTPAFELIAELAPSSYGFKLQFDSFVPTARRPEVQRRFQASLTAAELRSLRQLIDDALRAPEAIEGSGMPAPRLAP
jgi:hypothetical protein